MDPVLLALECVQRLRDHEDGIRILNHREYQCTVAQLKRCLSEAFPERQDIDEIVATLRGSPAHVPPRWWQRGWQVMEPSTEERVLSLLLGAVDPRYLPEDTIDPLGDLYREHVSEDLPECPASPALYAISALVDALLRGLSSFRVLREGRLVSLGEELERRFGASRETVDALRELSRKSSGLSWQERLSRFLAIPGAPELLDAILVLYSDLVAGRSVSPKAEAGMVLARAPVPERESAWFRSRLWQVYLTAGSVQVAARALRIRKADASRIVREIREKEELEVAA